MKKKNVLTARDRLIIPLDDCDDISDAMRLIDKLGPYAGTFKVGLDLISAGCAPTLTRHIHVAGAKQMYDGKFSDIPNTIERAVKRVADAGHHMFTIHSNCGRQSLEAAAEAKGNSLMLAVTVLSSLDGQDMLEIGYSKFDGHGRAMHLDLGLIPHVVFKMANIAAFVGADGVVCSTPELPIVSQVTYDLLKIVVGIRPAWSPAYDQKRLSTPTEAIKAGGDMLVIGRPITLHTDPVEAAKRVLDEIDKASA